MDKENFDRYVEEQIAPLLEDLEQQREQLANLGGKRMKIFNILVTVLTGAGAIYAGFYFASFWVFFGAVFSVFIAAVLFQDQLKAVFLKNNGLPKLQKEYKHTIISKVIEFFGKDWQYDPNGKVSKEDLLHSQLFHFGWNTTVKTDDVITGKFRDKDLMIVNVKSISSKVTDLERMRNASMQSFNGLMIRMKLPMEGEAFIIPKAKTNAGAGGLAGMKLLRDQSMSTTEQRTHNLSMLAQGIGGYVWSPSYSSLGPDLQKYEVQDNGQKAYEYHVNEEAFFEKLSKNETLQVLLSRAMQNPDAMEELVASKSFTLLDKHLMDKVVQLTLTYAIHSGYVWVLVPAFEEKFELSLERKISTNLVKDVYNDIRLTLTALTPFL